MFYLKPMLFHRLALFLTLAGLFAVPRVHAVEEIKVPFNFQWGGSAQRLEDSLKRVQANVVERKQVHCGPLTEGSDSHTKRCILL